MSIIASSKSELRKFFLSKRNKVTKKYSNYVSLEITNYAEEIMNTFALSTSINLGPKNPLIVVFGETNCLK